MKIEVFIYGFFCILILILLILCLKKIITKEQNRMKYYNSHIYYATNWDKYSTMVKKQKRILFLKKIQLFLLTLLVKVKR